MPVHSGFNNFSMKTIDINCDMGEGIGNDELIMPFISSANIACGYHAGDENTMKQTVELCSKHKVAIGAHPSFFDRENFGRTDFHLPLEEIYDLVTKQIHLLDKTVIKFGANLHHIKPHGALYNMAARDEKIAATIALAIKDINKELIVYGLAGSHLITEGKKIGLRTSNEVFADRTYQDDGSLTPRSKSNALIEDTKEMIQQVLQMINQKTASSITRKIIPIKADTICIHGDGKHAVEFAKKINEALKENNIVINTI